MEIRRAIYTTQVIESVNRSLRKVVKTKAGFPDEQSVGELTDLAMNNRASAGIDSLKTGELPCHTWLFRD